MPAVLAGNLSLSIETALKHLRLRYIRAFSGRDGPVGYFVQGEDD